MPVTARVYDVQRLRGWHAHVAALADDGPPAARVILPPREGAGGGAAVIAGSFNPVTNAHLSLCDGVLRQPGIDAAWFLLAVRTVYKEQVTGACLEDRLCMLAALVGSRPNVGVVLTNRGLYVDQAAALRRTLVPPGRELVFAVGFDKIQQILDPRYYGDREASLARLFSLSRFLVAERDTHGPAALADLLAAPANRSYRAHIAVLDTLPTFHDPRLSATGVRTAYAQADAAAPVDTEVPPVVADFIAATGVYAPPRTLPGGETVDRYAARLRLLAALFADPSAGFTANEFKAAVAVALSNAESGRRLRRALAQDIVTIPSVLACIGRNTVPTGER